ncbi:MAG: ATP-binding cassette domain-containing protein [Deltaproteobacteria bacterium]|nr:ATP-binding cassette domain-containing protein [Deltaproteobacteria bacterium]
MLLEGASGSGKSTLAAMLAGLRRPSRGLALLRGLDPATWGDARWRRRAVAAPQFHDNRVIAGTFAFNLLLGRDGLATRRPLAEAHALCVELGLGPLLEAHAGRAPAAGRRVRLAALPRRAEPALPRARSSRAPTWCSSTSFGALDPENQRRSLACALARAPTLVVIAHP